MREELLKLIENQLDHGDPPIIIHEHQTFTEVGADSLDVIELIMEIEDQLDIDIHDDIFEKTNTMTIGQFITYALDIQKATHEQPVQGAVAGRY